MKSQEVAGAEEVREPGEGPQATVAGEVELFVRQDTNMRVGSVLKARCTK